MKKPLRTLAMVVVLTMILSSLIPIFARQNDAGPVRFKEGSTTAAGIKGIFVHEVGNVRMTLSNWGEWGNPDQVDGYFGFEFPLGSENDFLYSAGVWVAGIKGGQKLVSTGTDGDTGTNEFAPLFDYWIATSDRLTQVGDQEFILGAKEIDDDGDWTLDDDYNGDGKPSTNWDGGIGVIGRDDDGDGLIDEELNNGVDDDGDGLIDEDTDESGDANGDGNCNYDPEGHIDEDPAGNMAADYIDNDFDGRVDGDDADYDGDMDPDSDDDDGDGLIDEDGNARGAQEYFVVYDDTDESQVQSPDSEPFVPLGVQVLQRTYSWGEQYRGEFIIIDLIIRNITEVPITEVYIGLFADADVAAKGESGDAASEDDWNFYDEANLMMIHGDDSTDEDGFGPGLFAMKVVKTPDALDSLDITFKNFERVAGGDPDLNVDKYDMLADSPANNSPPTLQLGDWRYLMGFGPKAGGWLLLPGAELPVTVACIAGRDIADIQRNAQWAQRIYDNDFQGPSSPDQPVFAVEAYPDHCRITWQDNAESSVDPITRIADFEGYVIQRSTNTNDWFTLTQYDVINSIDPPFERENLNKGMPWDIDPEPGTSWNWRLGDPILDTTQVPVDTVGYDTLGREYWYDDYEVVRGVTYYYIVRSFDTGVLGAGILITPVGRTYQDVIIGITPDSPVATPSLDDIWVVPNPYRGGHQEEADGSLNSAGVKYYPRKLKFMNLPVQKTRLDIYTLAGDHVVTLSHDGTSDVLYWDMRNKYAQEIVSGIYYFIAESDGMGMTIDKFAVLK